MNNKLTYYDDAEQNNNTLTNVFGLMLYGNYSEMQPEVSAESCDVRKVVEYKQNKLYRLTPEQYNVWPKIYSIAISIENKEVVTLEFRNKPNLSAVKNLLHLYSAAYSEKEFTIDKNSGKTVNTIRIETNSVKAIAHLFGIYSEMSVDAGMLIWEVFRALVEDSLDKDPLYDGWKHGIAYTIAVWAESIQCEESEACEHNDNYDFIKNQEYQAKLSYNRLDKEHKQQFLKNLVSYIINIKAAEIFSNLPLLDKYSTIENAFDSADKCLKYVASNMPDVKQFVESTSNLAQEIFVDRFEPTFWEKLTSDKGTKDIKVGGTGLGAGLSLLDKLGVLGKKLPIVQGIGLVLDVSKVFLSYAYVTKEDQPSEPIDISELATLLVCKDVVCNHSILDSLKPESLKVLIKFYGDFIYKEVKNNPSVRDYEDLTTYFIKRISDVSSFKELGLDEKSKVTLEKTSGEIVTIRSFISQYNLTKCYDELYSILTSSEKVSLQRENPSVPAIKAIEMPNNQDQIVDLPSNPIPADDSSVNSVPELPLTSLYTPVLCPDSSSNTQTEFSFTGSMIEKFPKNMVVDHTKVDNNICTENFCENPTSYGSLASYFDNCFL